jgi:V/A-type H+-transporting ATPase subunit I
MLIMPFIVWLLLNPFKIITGFIADILNSIMPPLPVVAGMFALGGLLVIIGEGIPGAIEVLFFSLMSNVLSYGRLMAVGLASVSLALVINDMAGQMFAMGLVGIIPGILVLVLGHTINIALGILSPFLHSLRLHYVEFFNKFYKGGGKRYKSFGYSE